MYYVTLASEGDKAAMILSTIFSAPCFSFSKIFCIQKYENNLYFSTRRCFVNKNKTLFELPFGILLTFVFLRLLPTKLTWKSFYFHF